MFVPLIATTVDGYMEVDGKKEPRMDLPPAIEAYFAADARRARELVMEAFTPDATVADEGLTHAGREAIGAWWSDTKARYQTVLEPLEVRDAAGAKRVRARVSGTFPGSPAMLTFAFRLRDGLIETLEIGA